MPRSSSAYHPSCRRETNIALSRERRPGAVVGNIVYAAYFQFFHNTRRRGKALLGTHVVALVG
jgi:protein-tyrosine phosphatase